MNRAAFIGLGVMGFPMAGHLYRAGFEVTVYNRTLAKAEVWVEQYGGQCAATPREAALGADIVCICVGNDEDLRSVVLGPDGVLAGLQAGATCIDHTTASANVARELYQECKNRGIGFIDAPVSGGQAGAEKGVLTVMCGGDDETFERARPILQSYSRSLRLLGPAGSGQLAKMVNQICIAGIVQGLAEAINFSETVGLNTADVIDVISKGAAQSWQMENRYQTMLVDQYNHGFAVDWMRKDLGMVEAVADEHNIPIPVARLVNEFYADVQAMGGGRWDTSSLLRRLQSQEALKQEEAR